MHAVSQHWYTDIDHAPKNEFAAEASLNEFRLRNRGALLCPRDHLTAPSFSTPEYGGILQIYF